LLKQTIIENIKSRNKWYHKQIHDFVAIKTHVATLPFGAILTFAIVPTHHYQPNKTIKINGCHARIKCRIWVDHYNYGTNPTCSQTWVILCIQFYFILRLKGSIKEKQDWASSFASCHDIHICNTFVEHHQI